MIKKLWNQLMGEKEVKQAKVDNSEWVSEFDGEVVDRKTMKLIELKFLLSHYWNLLSEEQVNYQAPHIKYTFEHNHVHYTISVNTQSDVLTVLGKVEEEMMIIAYARAKDTGWKLRFLLDGLKEESKEKIQNLLLDEYEKLVPIVDAYNEQKRKEQEQEEEEQKAKERLLAESLEKHL